MHDILITAGALIFGYLAYLFGDCLLGFFGARSPIGLRRFAYGTALGYGAFGLVSLALSLGGIFKAPALHLIFVIILAWNWSEVIGHVRALLQFFGVPAQIPYFLKRLWGTNGFLRALTVIWVLLNFFIVFVPLTGHDTLDYHLPIINDLATTGRFDFTSAIEPYRYLPALGELIYATTVVAFGNFTDPRVFQLVQYSMLLLFLVIMYEFLRPRLSNRFLVLSLPLLILSVMDFQRELLHGGYVDVLAFVFGIASSVLVVEHAVERRVNFKKIGLSALLLGLALSVKYTGLFFGVINGVFLLLYFIRSSPGFRQFLSLIARYGLIVLLIAGFWYGKNVAVFGNPVYPIFSENKFAEEIGYFISDRTLPNLAVFPFWRYGQWFVQDVETSSRLVILGYFIMLYSFIIYFLLARRRLAFLEVLILLFVEIYLALLFLSSHQYRFLLPAILMVPALLLLFTDKFYNFLRVKYGELVHRRLVRVSTICAGLAFFLVFLGNLHYFAVKWHYLLGNFTKQEYTVEIGGQ